MSEQKKSSGVGAFFRSTFATVLGISLFFGMGVFIFIMIGLSSGDEPEPIKSNSVLKLNFNKPIVEYAAENPDMPDIDLPLPGLADLKVIGLSSMKKAIRDAAKDESIKGIYLELSNVSAGWATHRAIREELLKFKETGKFILAYSEVCTETAYYLASVADEFYLNPQGMVEFNGLNSEIMFFKGAFEKLGVEPKIFRVGKYKSAVEPFLRKDMSEKNKEQVTAYLNSIYDTYLNEISASKNISTDELERISDSMFIENAQDAEEYKLAKVGYYDEVMSDLRARLEIEEDDKISFVSLTKYRKSNPFPEEYNKNKIAVIVGQGNIVSGSGDNDEIGSDKIAKQIRKARKDENVKAIVMRINSPGGSALASDVMWREIQLAKEVKPVIASMSDLAASGGYYMAMGCDEIYAHPNTITGSIGIFGMLFEVDQALKERVGLTFDRVGTGKHAGMGGFIATRPFTPEEENMIQNMVNEGYATFTSKAAKGRNMPLDTLLNYASGRVWTGEQAVKIGLVDKLGGLDEAVAAAAAKAELGEGDYMVKFMPEKKPFLQKLLEDGGLSAEGPQAFDKDAILKHELGEFYEYYKMLDRVKGMAGVQARLPYEIEVR